MPARLHPETRAALQAMRPAKVTRGALNELAGAIGRDLPEGYCELMLALGAAEFSPLMRCAFDMQRRAPDHTETREGTIGFLRSPADLRDRLDCLLPTGWPAHLLPIGGNWGDDEIVLDLEDGTIGLAERGPEGYVLHCAAPDLDSFLTGLRRQEG